MKKICQYFVTWMILLSLVLTSCATGGGGGSADPGADQTCQEGVCVSIDIAQPIVLNQPANVTITLSSSVDKPGLLVHLQASPTNVTFGPNNDWHYDAVANQSKVLTSTVMLTSSGEYMIAAEVYVTGGPLVENFERVLIDSKGAVVNPTIVPVPTWNGHPIASPPPPEALTATAKAEADTTLTPYPTKPPVEGFTPQEWLQKCGWDVKKPDKLSFWTGISAWLDIKETQTIGETVNGTFSIGFKDKDHPDVPIPTKIGLCTVGKGWTTDTTHEWNIELHSGKPEYLPVTLRFTNLGDIPIFFVAFDAKNNRIYGSGRLIYVKTKEQSSISPAAAYTKKEASSTNQVGIMTSSPQWRLVASEAFSSTRWPSGSPQWRVVDTTVENPELDIKWGVRQTDLAA